MRCSTLDRRLAAMVDDPHLVDDALEAHVSTCLRCQAERARYRRLRRAMTDLRTPMPPADDSLLDDILGAIDASGRRVRSGARRARQAACTLVAAAGAAGAIVVVGRVRHRRLAG